MKRASFLILLILCMGAGSHPWPESGGSGGSSGGGSTGGIVDHAFTNVGSHTSGHCVAWDDFDTRECATLSGTQLALPQAGTSLAVCMLIPAGAIAIASNVSCDAVAQIGAKADAVTVAASNSGDPFDYGSTALDGPGEVICKTITHTWAQGDWIRVTFGEDADDDCGDGDVNCNCSDIPINVTTWVQIP